MKTSIFIVSYAKHYPYLEKCLKSIAKFATGFHELVVLVPDKDLAAFPIGIHFPDTLSVSVLGEPEWEGKGFLWHMDRIMHADQYCKGDWILHTDSDCVFTEPVTPQDYFVDGKAVLCYASYDWLCKHQENIRLWQVAVENAIGFKPVNEFMRRHPAVHTKEVYPLARALIESRHCCSTSEYMKVQREAFPQTFAEFPTLGEVAWKYLPHYYHFVDQEKHGLPKSKIYQGWGRGPMREVDLEVYRKAGL